MDYEKIYKDLCTSRKYRGTTKGDGYEIHHIVPKTLGGGNEEENLVKFTYREHYIAHRLLTKIYPDNFGLLLAVSYLMKNDVKFSKDFERVKTQRQSMERYNIYVNKRNSLKGKIDINPFLRNFDLIIDPHISIKRVVDNGLSNIDEKIILKYGRERIYRVYGLFFRIRSLGYTGIYGLHHYEKGLKGLTNKYFKGLLKRLDIKLEDMTLDGYERFFYNYNKFHRLLFVSNGFSYYQSVRGALHRWNKANPDKLISIVMKGNYVYNIVPVTSFLERDYEDRMYIFKDIDHKTCYRVLKRLIENHSNSK